MTCDRYFIASNPDRRYCPFGRDCMYQHLNEDGTPYIFTRGVDYYMPVSADRAHIITLSTIQIRSNETVACVDSFTT